VSDGTYDPEAILADPFAHPIHKAYAAINIDVRDNGATWSKCANCGDPYKLTEAWSAAEICGDACWRDYMAYLNGGF
jgi:hypothetical protein